LGSPPARRTRRAYLHHWHSTVRDHRSSTSKSLPSRTHEQGERIQTLLEIVPEGSADLKVRTTKQVQNRLSLAELDELLAQYQAGMTVKDLAHHYRLHRCTVSHILTRHNVTRRPKGIPPELLEDAIAAYQAGSSLATIGAKVAVNAMTVSVALRKAGIPIRPRPGWT
jgi:hypothetical protein